MACGCQAPRWLIHCLRQLLLTAFSPLSRAVVKGSTEPVFPSAGTGGGGVGGSTALWSGREPGPGVLLVSLCEGAAP